MLEVALATVAFDRAAAVVTGDALPDEANVPADRGPSGDDRGAGAGGRAPVDPDPERVDEGVREVIDSTDPSDRDNDFGREVADEADRHRQDADATERPGVSGDGTDEAGSGLSNRPVDPPAGPSVEKAGGPDTPEGS